MSRYYVVRVNRVDHVVLFETKEAADHYIMHLIQTENAKPSDKFEVTEWFTYDLKTTKEVWPVK